MVAVKIFANMFKPDSCGFSGRDELSCADRRRLVARPRANAGNANDWVNVSLCNDSLKEYGPTEPLAAARSSAYLFWKKKNQKLYFEISIYFHE